MLLPFIIIIYLNFHKFNKMTTIYYGQIQCQSETKKGPCANKAYYLANSKYVCGVHSRSLERTTLPKISKSDLDKQTANNFAQELKAINEAKISNLMRLKKGDIVVTKMYMMKASKHVPGYLNVYPNYKDGNRKDGLGLPLLSPKSIGPVMHCQPGLTPSKNLENLHQFNKVFKCDVNEKGDPNETFYKMRLQGYNDPK